MRDTKLNTSLHKCGRGSVSRGMGGQEKKMGFSDIGLYALVHKQFQKSISGKSFVSSPTSKVMLFLFCGE